MGRNRQAGIVAAAAVLVGGMMFPLTGRSVFAAEALSAKDLFAKVSPAVVRVIAHGQVSGGMRQESGFIVAKGLVVTNHRFLENARNAEIVMSSGGRRVAVKGFAAEDVSTDMVLLSVASLGEVTPAVLADKRPAVGAKVFFISRPLGRSTGIAPGLVTGFREVSKTLSLMECGIQAPDGAGGGAVFSEAGLVLGAAAPALGADKDRGTVVPCDRLKALLGARGKVRPLTELSRSPGTTTRYSSMVKALSEIPAKFFPTRNVKFNNIQKDMVNKWIKENLIGSEVLFKGRLDGPPKGGSGGGDDRLSQGQHYGASQAPATARGSPVRGQLRPGTVEVQERQHRCAARYAGRRRTEQQELSLPLQMDLSSG